MRIDDSEGVLRGMLRKTVRRASRLERSSMPGMALPQPKGWFSSCQRCGYEIFAPSPYVVCMRMTDHVLEEHALEWAFCFLRFRDFAALAEHVNEAHTPPEKRRAIQPMNNWWEENDMLPQPGGGKTESQRGGGKQTSGRPAPTVPFLKVEDLKTDPVRAKILAVQSTNTGFNDVIVKVAVNGRSYFFGLKASNPNYESLFKAFGDDDNKWVGQEFMVGLNWNEFYEKNFVHIFEAPAPERKNKK